MVKEVWYVRGDMQRPQPPLATMYVLTLSPSTLVQLMNVKLVSTKYL